MKLTPAELNPHRLRSEPNLGPCVASLRLTPEERDSLKWQGFVAGERRGGTQYFKLRFRYGGRQRVCYLGRDPEIAAKIARELAAMQQEHETVRELARLTRAARKLLRDSKRGLEPYLRDAGFKFHGLQIRRVRTSSLPKTDSPAQDTRGQTFSIREEFHVNGIIDSDRGREGFDGDKPGATESQRSSRPAGAGARLSGGGIGEGRPLASKSGIGSKWTDANRNSPGRGDRASSGRGIADTRKGFEVATRHRDPFTPHAAGGPLRSARTARYERSNTNCHFQAGQTRDVAARAGDAKRRFDQVIPTARGRPHRLSRAPPPSKVAGQQLCLKPARGTGIVS